MTDYKVVCLIGSMKSQEVFQQAARQETLAGNAVLRIDFDLESDPDYLADVPESERDAVKARLEQLNQSKIDMADEILVIYVGGSIGNSTKELIKDAKRKGKKVRYWEAGGSSMISLVTVGVPGLR